MKRPTAPLTLTPLVDAEGLAYRLPGVADGDWWNWPSRVPEAFRGTAAYLGQLANEGFAAEHDGALRIGWADLFEVLRSADHAGSIALLNLPVEGDWVPCLETRGTPSDTDFAIAVVAWQSAKFGRLFAQRTGATLRVDGQSVLLSEAAWRTSEKVTALAKQSGGLSPSARMHALGEIRVLAVQANALLDDYLKKTDIVAPTRLDLELQREDLSGIPVIELIPKPEGAPENFVATFDKYGTVRERYDISQPDGGIVHVAPSPAVTKTLEAVKELPGRRVASDQARLFGHNPFAVLGEEARLALDEEALIRAREQAGLLPYRLTFAVLGDGSASIGLVPIADRRPPVVLDGTVATAKALLERSAQSRARGLPLFHWEGNEIELGSATEAALTAMARWLATHGLQQARLTLADILDLDAYSDRVVGFEGRVQTVPYVAKRDASAGWVPENIETGIVAVDRDSGETRHVPMSPEDVDDLRERVLRAESQGAAEVALPNSDVRVPVSRARELVSAFEEAEIRVGRRRAPETLSDPKPDGQRSSLQILHNVEQLDYVARAIEQFDSKPSPHEIPKALRPTVELLPHQQDGLAWLQHRYEMRHSGMTGCLLADDMGLGKTLQSLSLIAWHHERSKTPKPCLVVAPVSLLENWKAEIRKFLDWSSDDVLSLYGLALSALKVSKSHLDPSLADAGVRKLLQPGFETNCKVVLTTYETLRDYEFSLARVGWGIVVCDEAQKIKNPAAFVTQAAKALRADFRIACTGTPVENSLADLWCLFDYFQPGYLGSLNGFTKEYRRDIETRADGHMALVERLRTSTQAWVLRRMKNEVHKGLPKKLERDQADPSCEQLPMSAVQARLYAEAVGAYRASRESADDEAKGTQILALLARLRTICAHPLGALTSDAESKAIAEHEQASPKLAWLLKRLSAIRDRGEKVIVFTEFRDLQRLVQRAVAERFQYAAAIVNGSTAVDARSDESRQRVIDRFQAEAGFGVIVLSTTAVGFGVNIQAANHVIHFTRPWNPAKEDQATDRAYRIGQTKDVYVYCPTVIGQNFESFEQRLAALLNDKRELSRDMLAGVQEITADDFVDFGLAAS